MSRASEDKLGRLHEQLAEVLTECIKPQDVEEVDKETGQPTGKTIRLMPSPAHLAVAAKFLKDNEITATRGQSDALEKLTAAQQANRERRAQRAALNKRDLREAGLEVDASLGMPSVMQ